MERSVSSKKFKTTVVSLCLGFLMVVGAVIGVWAASTQNYKAGFNVSYSVGDNVAAKVRTEYYIPNQDGDKDGVEDGAQTVTTNEAGDTVTGEDGYVTFNAGDSNETGAEVYIGNFNLTPQTPSIIFYFTVYNMLEEGYLQVVVDEDYTTKENVSVKTTYVNPESFALSSSASTIAGASWGSSNKHTNAEAVGYKVIRVELSVDNINKAALIAGDVSLGLYYSSNEESASMISKAKFKSAATAYYETNYAEMKFDYAQRDITYPRTGTDVSEAGDGSIWFANGSVYSYDTIIFPEDCSNMFFITVPMTEEMRESYGWYGDNYIPLGRINFKNCDTSNVTNMSSMFAGYDDYTDLYAINGLENFDTSNVTNMSYMFANCEYLSEFDVSNFDTSKVTNMSGMFYNDFKDKQSFDLSNWDTSSVTDMSEMFACSNVLEILDLSGWDTSSVTDMSSMFNVSWLGGNLRTIFVGKGWSIEKVTLSSGMFEGCENLVGAVAYDSSKTDHTMANWETGYLTYKA
ncbi:MAG: BspA family leucine-rich repeat surface protein [Clostridiales bacterium]|nr:BspA family leucine-rich repeat surface protein [Clostridiales bacterium]